MTNKLEFFSVAIFDYDDDREEVIEGGLSWEEAKILAQKLWSSNKYYGVEVIDDCPNNMDPIVWIKCKRIAP